jgi:DNA polymerase I-like protein with 3'-5' exonuclease and polymerase domains
MGATDLGTYSFLSSSIDLERICNEILRDKPLVSFDLETTGRNPLIDRILMVSFSRSPSHAYVFIPGMIDIGPFLKVLECCDIMNHYIKFDYEFIKAAYGIETNIFWDTQVTHSIAVMGMAMELGGNGLGNLMSKYFGITLKKELRKDFGNTDTMTDDYISYSAMDSLAVQRLYPVTRKILEDSGCEHIWTTIEKPLIKVIANMELDGINVDFDSMLEMRDKYQEKVNQLELDMAESTKYEKTIKVRCGCSVRPRGTVICDQCNGKKKLKCETCGGKRKSDCTDCGGTGKIVCSKCLGVGRVQCSKCKGEGFVDQTITVSVNPGSPSQVIEYFHRMNVKIPQKDTNSGGESVDEKSLERIRHPLAKTLLEYRGYSKALSTFLIPWSSPCDTDSKGRYNPNTKCIHAEITQTDTNTGRCSMKSPNLQQVPRELEFRKLFKAPEGYKLVTCDFSQIELRVLAEISEDANMRQIFINRGELYNKLQALLSSKDQLYYTHEFGETCPEAKELHELIERDNDIHSQTAIRIFKLDPLNIDWDSSGWKTKRAASKCVSFGIPYGSGARTVAMRSEGALTETEAAKTITNYFAAFPKVKAYIDNAKHAYVYHTCDKIAEDLKLPYGRVCWSKSPGGRKRFYILPKHGASFEEISIGRAAHASIQRQVVNQPIQGCSADITKLAMVMISDKFSEPRWENKVKLRLMVHDELVVSCPAEWAGEVAAIQMELMNKASSQFLPSVPSEVSCAIGDCWEK